MVIAAIVPTTTACDFGDGGHYSAASTNACLRRSRLKPTREVDPIASRAPEGAFHVRLANNSVTVSFWENESDAQGRVRSYGVVAVAEMVTSTRNVLLAWEKDATEEERERIERCLKST